MFRYTRKFYDILWSSSCSLHEVILHHLCSDLMTHKVVTALSSGNLKHFQCKLPILEWLILLTFSLISHQHKHVLMWWSARQAERQMTSYHWKIFFFAFRGLVSHFTKIHYFQTVIHVGLNRNKGSHVWLFTT